MKTTTLEKKVATIEKLVELTKSELPRISTHLYNIWHQFTHLKQLKENLTQHDVVVHVDYSENYTCKWSKEIKDAHFGGSHQQVTLHTGVLYYTGGQAESFATVSASLQHDAVATWAHLQPVLGYITSNYPLAKNIHFLSDGPTSQYRNKVAFYLASTVPFMKGFKTVTWNFTEASHGKGAPDGVGGALKNLADRVVAYGTDIPNASALLENLAKHSSVRLFEVTEDNIAACGELVPPFLKSVPGTMKIHQVVATEPGNIRFREVSCFCSHSCDCFSPKEFVFTQRESEETIKVGTWVLVDYDGDLYPGTVTQIASGQYEVDTMSCAGDNRFYIPSIRFAGEKVWYYLDDIKEIIPEPLPTSSSARHFCVVSEIWAKYKKKVQLIIKINEYFVFLCQT
ncbi:uncharacterized protein LOC119791359 [Cyprinodon tularosa]|uniref:uncharacterized protein LOC119791359 n=2 Tax=Cyprinodon tularosa TaxID=77115 RepID=UPI0018E267A8|nr:uncharacterized protein LOC119791359 [Cyprinodon tularosa]